MSHEAVRDRGQGALLTVLCAGVFMVYLDSTVVNVALPKIQADLGAGVTQLQWVVDAYALAFASLLLTSGAVGDIVGRRRIFLLGVAAFTAASVLCALATSIGALLVARAVQGAVGAGLIPISLALITQLYADPAKRARMIGLWAGIGGLALAAGPVIGGALVDDYGWQSIFWINVPLGVLATAALSRLLPHTQVRVTQHLDALGQVLFVAATGLLAYALIEGNGRGWDSPLIVATFAGAALCLIAFVGWQLRNPQPLLPLAFFRNRVFAAACAVNFLGLFGLFGVIFLLTLYLQTINGLSPIQTGVRFLALTVSIMVASALGPTAARRWGTRVSMVAGSLFTVAGCLWLTETRVNSGFATYAGALVLLGIGVSLCAAPATVALLASVPDDRAGTASGVSNTFRQIGGVFGVAMAGAVVLRHLQASLTPIVRTLPVSDAAKQSLLDAIGRGDVTPLRGLPDGLRQVTIARAAQEFVTGMHGAFLVAAAGGLISGLIALFWMPWLARTPAYRPRHGRAGTGRRGGRSVPLTATSARAQPSGSARAQPSGSARDTPSAGAWPRRTA
jgi:EmrB/QacA subfamily drug resistance transporter